MSDMSRSLLKTDVSGGSATATSCGPRRFPEIRRNSIENLAKAAADSEQREFASRHEERHSPEL
jgi:hypothetical protein